MQALKDFWETMPFNRLLGVVIETFDKDQLLLTLRMREDLVGNHHKGSPLHGGVIAAIIDTTGGMLASIRELTERLRSQKVPRQDVLGKGGTVDLRVDYLRPGVGNTFFATGAVVRHGVHLIVTKMELANERRDLIAIGTGTYFVN